MRNLLSILITLAAISFFTTSCQKDNLEDLNTTVQEYEQLNPINQEATLLLTDQDNTQKDSQEQFIEETAETAALFESIAAYTRATTSTSTSRNSTTLVPEDILYCGYNERHDTRNGANGLNTGSNPCYNRSSSFNGPDQHFLLTVQQSQQVTISISNMQTDLDLFVFTLNSNGSIRSCKASSTKSNTAKDAVTLTLSSGSYLVSVDGYASNIQGAYTLKVECPNTNTDDCCDKSVVDSWLPGELAKFPTCQAVVKCCFYNGRPVIDIDWRNSGCRDLGGALYTCDGSRILTYETIVGGSKPYLTNCTTISTTPTVPEEGCQNIPSNCQAVSCSAQTPQIYEGYYSCTINASYSGGKEIAYWTVNGQRKDTRSSNPSFTVNSSGTYTICCYFYCNGVLYKCCKVVTCPPVEESGCGGSCNNDDFSRYTSGRKIAQQSSSWRTWNSGQAGTSQDAWVTQSSTGRNILSVESGNDVVHNLGNKRSGTHCLATRLWVRSGKKAYYNIQSDYNQSVSSGYWNISFANGRATLAHTSYSFTYNSNEWMDIYMKFHTNTGKVEFVCEQGGRVIGQKTLNYQSISLGGINFYGQSNAEFYVDYVKVNCGTSGYFNEDSTTSSSRSASTDRITKEVVTSMESIKVPFTSRRADTQSTLNREQTDIE